MARHRLAMLAFALAAACVMGSVTVATAAEITYDGDQLQIVMTDTGMPTIRVKPSTAAGPADPYVGQYYEDEEMGTTSWGSVIWLYSAESSSSYSAGYQSAGATFVPVSNTTETVPGGTAIVNVVDLGTSGVRLTQRFTHLTGDRFVTKQWTITNNGSTTFTGVRHYHGGDTYFGGEDHAFGFWDASKGMVYVRNMTFADWGLMGFYADPATPSSRYVEAEYHAADAGPEAGADLSDTVENSDFVDAGYYLQWDRGGSLAPGESWTIKAYELWTPAGALQMFAPPPKDVVGGTTVPLPFTLQNLSDTTMTLSLTAACDTGWSTSIVGGASQELPPNSSVVRTVNVTVPTAASGVAGVTLSSSGGGIANASVRLSATPDASRFYVGAPHLKWTVRRGRSFEVYGELAPGHPRGKWVVLRFERRTARGYRFVKNVTTYSYATPDQPSNHYGVWTRMSTRGRYRVRAFHPADADGPATWTGWNWFRVR